jgi:hypothetical protein
MRIRAKGRAEERRGRAVLEEMDGGPTKAGRRLLGLGWAGPKWVPPAWAARLVTGGLQRQWSGPKLLATSFSVGLSLPVTPCCKHLTGLGRRHPVGWRCWVHVARCVFYGRPLNH